MEDLPVAFFFNELCNDLSAGSLIAIGPGPQPKAWFEISLMGSGKKLGYFVIAFQMDGNRFTTEQQPFEHRGRFSLMETPCGWAAIFSCLMCILTMYTNPVRHRARASGSGKACPGPLVPFEGKQLLKQGSLDDV